MVVAMAGPMAVLTAARKAAYWANSMAENLAELSDMKLVAKMVASTVGWMVGPKAAWMVDQKAVLTAACWAVS